MATVTLQTAPLASGQMWGALTPSPLSAFTPIICRLPFGACLSWRRERTNQRGGFGRFIEDATERAFVRDLRPSPSLHSLDDDDDMPDPNHLSERDQMRESFLDAPDLLTSFLQRDNPPDLRHVNGVAVCPRWLALDDPRKSQSQHRYKLSIQNITPPRKVLPKTMSLLRGDRLVSQYIEASRSREPCWAHLPFEVLCHIMRRVCCAHAELPSPSGGGAGRFEGREALDGKEPDVGDGENSDGGEGEEFDESDSEDECEPMDETWSSSAEVDLYACLLVCRGWAPAASEVLWEWVQITSKTRFADLAFASFYLSLCYGREQAGNIRYLDLSFIKTWHVSRERYMPFFEKLQGLRGLTLLKLFSETAGALIKDILPLLYVTSPRLIMLNKPYDDELLETDPILRDGVVQIARTLHKIRVPPHPSTDLQYGPHKSRRGRPRPQGLANNCLSRLECIEFPAAQRGTPNISINFIVKLASLQPPLRWVVLARSHLADELLLACLLHSYPTIEELDISGCKPVTDATLAILGNHPPLRSLNISALPKITVPEIVMLLLKRGSRLCLLVFDSPRSGKQKLVMFAAIASNAPNLKHLQTFQWAANYVQGVASFPTQASSMAFIGDSGFIFGAPRTLSLVAAPNGPQERIYPCVATLGTDSLLVSGGNSGNGSHPFGDTFVFNILSNSWTIVPVTPMIRSGAPCATINGSVYLFGGTDIFNAYNGIWMFDSNSHAWKFIQSASGLPPSPRAFASMTSVNSRWLVVSGGPLDNQFYYFDLFALEWYDGSTGSPLITLISVSSSSSTPASSGASIEVIMGPVAGVVFLAPAVAFALLYLRRRRLLGNNLSHPGVPRRRAYCPSIYCRFRISGTGRALDPSPSPVH
ncbi:hypothetical protein BDK51DRAFT_44106, partial [Blyttiomyces helicus]